MGTATHLGDGVVDLAILEPFEATEVELPVTHQKDGEKGSLQIRMMFQPESESCEGEGSRLIDVVIARTRGKTSTFSTAGRAITQIGGVPLAAGKGVFHGGEAVAMGVGHGIGSVGGFAGRRIGLIKKKDKHGKEVLVEPSSANGEAYDVPAGQVSQPADQLDVEGIPAGGVATTLPPGMGSSPAEAGSLTVTVLSAKDLSSKEAGSAKPYVVLRLGGKSHKTGHVKGVEPEW